MAAKISAESDYENSLVCECEDVTVGEVKYAIEELDVTNLKDLRRRTRVGMGTCQGELCACRALACLLNLTIVQREQRVIWLHS